MTQCSGKGLLRKKTVEKKGSAVRHKAVAEMGGGAGGGSSQSDTLERSANAEHRKGSGIS